ncbi:MAG: energy-coupling factor transporter transmembrane protein EcfT [Chloroflexi bacterium]|nr:energy-coupling factor transporter transmembrane protein EcfT [Chloroflexota bacterium]
MFTYQAHASPLHRVNPSIKLITMTAVGLAATFVYHPFVPGLLALGLWLTAWWFGRLPFRLMLRWTGYMLALAWPLVIFTALYTDLSRYPQPHIYWSWGPWALSREGWVVASAVGLRMIVFMSASLLFIATTSPTDFAMSLAQNLHVPYRFAYGLLVAYRFLPSLRQEFQLLQLAHQVRGVAARPGLRGLVERWRRYATPLLAASLRKAERTALAMDAKAFGAFPERTYYRQLPIRGRDVGFLLIWLVYIAVVYALAARWHMLGWMWVPDA